MHLPAGTEPEDLAHRVVGKIKLDPVCRVLHAASGTVPVTRGHSVSQKSRVCGRWS